MGCWGLQAWQGDENTFMWRLASGGKTDGHYVSLCVVLQGLCSMSFNPND